MNYLAILEGLLFVVGEEGLSIDQVKKILEIDDNSIKELINKLKQRYISDDYGICIEFLGNTFKLTTKKEHKDYYQKLIIDDDAKILSQAALETLAIIAYNQPVTRIKVDDIRGVSSALMIRKLVAKGLVKEIGRSDLPGRPIIYETTNDFLDYFGLSNINELPSFDEFIENDFIEETQDLYTSNYKDRGGIKE
ncbi:MAG: SMC-Scp complex subunit ScpB [Tenericutes bacterium]|jgi:segregation and condensation protein B|nr:SMC-Scp complex subunit ScpB [Mycoplasmatota bacterium]